MTACPWEGELTAAIAQRKEAGQYRFQRVRESAQGVHIVLDGKPGLSFCSNDYLGLADNPIVKQALMDAVQAVGVGAGAAHLLTGHSRYHQQLEAALADFTGQARVLLFSSGYQANMGVIAALLTDGDAVIQDKLNHASLLDGARLSGARLLRYPHRDMTRLHQRLHNAANYRHKLIVTDGVFSMDGDIAPLPEIMAQAKQHHAAILVDEAHAFGVLGATGRGSCEYWQIDSDERPIIVGTFGKALGTAGAFVAADDTIIETLIQQARTYIYTTAQPACLAAATLASLALMQQESWRREKLQALISRFRQGAEALGLNVMPSITPIQPVIIGEAQRAIELGQSLEEKGIFVGVVRPPTVPRGTARLRITFSANHDEQDVDRLLDALEQSHAY